MLLSRPLTTMAFGNYDDGKYLRWRTKLESEEIAIAFLERISESLAIDNAKEIFRHVDQSGKVWLVTIPEQDAHEQFGSRQIG
jgi:hypothetical protein